MCSLDRARALSILASKRFKSHQSIHLLNIVGFPGTSISGKQFSSSSSLRAANVVFFSVFLNLDYYQ